MKLALLVFGLPLFAVLVVLRRARTAPPVHRPPIPAEPDPYVFFHVADAEGTSVEGSTFVRLPKARHLSEANWTRDPAPTGCVPKLVYRSQACAWCSSTTRACSKGGRLAIRRFPNEVSLDAAPTLEELGIHKLLLLRPATKQHTPGEPDIDQVHITCSGLSPPIPPNEPGVLTLAPDKVSFNSKFAQFVTPRRARPGGAGGVFVCTRSLHTFTFAPKAVELYLKHYLEVWQVSKVFLYEMGVNGGVLLEDVLQDSGELKSLLDAGRIELVDLRDELQRQYGPVAGDVVLFSKRLGRDVQGADCLARAKAQGADWVLNLEWHDVLAFGRDGEPRPLAEVVRAFAPPSRHVNLVRLSTLRAPADKGQAACVDCPLMWAQQLAAASDAPGVYTAGRYFVRAQVAQSWGFSPHTFAMCALPNNSQVAAIPHHAYHLRQYACSDNQCGSPSRPGVNWALDFGGKAT
ncbi:hypothetical protein BASA81_001860 [Batrachochytrium salamandrivorans]|nr:hypothetical protein BASA81_008745 [Batrachochytrium salamandrivorans]KAH9260088.1 hypothetical protein BASA81_001860 [Batrachochytrium salamandrivorans]